MFVEKTDSNSIEIGESVKQKAENILRRPEPVVDFDKRTDGSIKFLRKRNRHFDEDVR